jgi:hypothetical protein
VEKMTKRFWLSTLPLVALAVAPARADLVSVTGGFTNFSGNVIGNDAPSFINGTQVCPDSGCGTLFDIAHVTFPVAVGGVQFFNLDSPLPGGRANTLNELQFIPAAPQNVPGPGSPFELGTFVFVNGIWSDTAYFGFQLVSDSSNSALNGHPFDAVVRMQLTPNLPTNTPAQNADIVDFLDPVTLLPLVDPATGVPLPSLRVPELADGNNVGSVVLNGEIGSLLLTGFSDPTGGLFLDSSHDLAPSGSPSGTVPEPSTVLLLGTALAVVIRHVRPRNNTVKAG